MPHRFHGWDGASRYGCVLRIFNKAAGMEPTGAWRLCSYGPAIPDAEAKEKLPGARDVHERLVQGWLCEIFNSRMVASPVRLFGSAAGFRSAIQPGLPAGAPLAVVRWVRGCAKKFKARNMKHSGLLGFCSQPCLSPCRRYNKNKSMVLKSELCRTACPCTCSSKVVEGHTNIEQASRRERVHVCTFSGTRLWDPSPLHAGLVCGKPFPLYRRSKRFPQPCFLHIFRDNFK